MTNIEIINSEKYIMSEIGHSERMITRINSEPFFEGCYSLIADHKKRIEELKKKLCKN